MVRGLYGTKATKQEIYYKITLLSAYAASTQFDLKASVVLLDTTTGYIYMQVHLNSYHKTLFYRKMVVLPKCLQ